LTAMGNMLTFGPQFGSVNFFHRLNEV
jgi:hypothetical protein